MTVVTASPNQWFVETDFGALLGPMPADALVEMARTGALLPRDRVRPETDGSWYFASDVSGLFDGIASPLSQPAARPGDQSREAIPDGPFGADNASEVLRRRQPNVVDERSPSRVAVPRPSPLRSPTKPESPFDVVASSTDPLKELLESWPEERERQPAPSGAGSALEELDFELDVSVVASTAVSKPSSSPRPVVCTEHEPPQPGDPTPPPEPVTATEPLPRLETAWRSPSPAHLTARRFPTHLQPRRWKRRLLISTVSAAVLSVFAVTWWTWPRNRPDIYAQYVAVYKKLQQRRENTSDEAGWNDFVAQARAEIEENLPWLESQARPGAREKSLLLYVGRDLHEMLGRPRESEYPHQQRVDGFLNQLQAIYTPSKSNER
jgi:hypothetical protein